MTACPEARDRNDGVVRDPDARRSDLGRSDLPDNW
jgi:hypothetical protein